MSTAAAAAAAWSALYVPPPDRGYEFVASRDETSGGATASQSTRDSDTSSLSSAGSFSRDGRYQALDRPMEPGVIDTCEQALENGDDAAFAAVASSHGLASNLRGRIWPLLLQNHPFVRRPNMPVIVMEPGADEVPHKRLNGELRRMRQRVPFKDEWEPVIEEAVSRFLTKWAGRTRYEPALLWIAHFLLAVVDIPGDRLNSVFEQLMLVFGWGGDRDLSASMSLFIGRLRIASPALATHFDAEDVLNSLGGDEWLVWWIKAFGVRAWAATDVARIWDSYVGWRPEQGTPPPRTAHVYTCLALMKSQEAKLLELDQSEMRQLLGRLPPSKDLEMLLQEATQLREHYEPLSSDAIS